MPSRSVNPGGASRVRRRALLGTAVLVVLVVLAGLAAYLTRDSRTSTPPAPRPRTVASASPTAPAPSAEHAREDLPVPPSTRSPITFAKAAAEAVWSYDTRAYTQPELLTALHGWLTQETKYADPASVDALIPSPTLWREMSRQGQFATATVNEGHFPASFTRALQTDPGAITSAYVYAVTVSGTQSVAWNGAPKGGAQGMSMTFAVQCRPARPCALAGVLPAVAP